MTRKINQFRFRQRTVNDTECHSCLNDQTYILQVFGSGQGRLTAANLLFLGDFSSFCLYNSFWLLIFSFIFFGNCLMNSTKYYAWVGNKSGYIWAIIRDYKLYPKQGERFKYLGYTTDIGWPKKLNTGRILYKQSSESFKKYRRKEKKMLS